MNLKELKTKTEQELQTLLADNRNKLKELRFKDANGQLKNVREIRLNRELTARILTLLNSKK